MVIGAAFVCESFETMYAISHLHRAMREESFDASAL